MSKYDHLVQIIAEGEDHPASTSPLPRKTIEPATIWVSPSPLPLSIERAAERIAAWLPSLPVGLRRYAQAHAYQRLRATGPGPYGVDEIAAVLDAIGTELNGRG